jgi:hypothetical protein
MLTAGVTLSTADVHAPARAAGDGVVPAALDFGAAGRCCN